MRCPICFEEPGLKCPHSIAEQMACCSYSAVAMYEVNPEAFLPHYNDCSDICKAYKKLGMDACLSCSRKLN